MLMTTCEFFYISSQSEALQGGHLTPRNVGRCEALPWGIEGHDQELFTIP